MDEREAVFIVPVKIMGAGHLSDEEVLRMLKAQHMSKIPFPLTKDGPKKAIHVIAYTKRIEIQKD